MDIKGDVCMDIRILRHCVEDPNGDTFASWQIKGSKLPLGIMPTSGLAMRTELFVICPQ